MQPHKECSGIPRRSSKKLSLMQITPKEDCETIRSRVMQLLAPIRAHLSCQFTSFRGFLFSFFSAITNHGLLSSRGFADGASPVYSGFGSIGEGVIQS